MALIDKPDFDLPLGLTVKSAKRAITEQFTTIDILSPTEEARELLIEVTGFSLTDIVLRGDEALSVDQYKRLKALMSRRLAGEPVDNILGWREFYGRRFKVSKYVLSPRGDTETLINCSLDALSGFLNGCEDLSVLDLGTGSGAILITLLSEIPALHGVGVDISEKALSVAQNNAEALNVTDRARFLSSEWFSNVTGQYDLIVSNPPYITNTAMEGLSEDVLGFDPDIALRGGETGLDAYKVIISEAQNYLKPGGSLWVEIGYDQGEAVQSLFALQGFKAVQCVKDLAGHDRCVGGIFATLD